MAETTEKIEHGFRWLTRDETRARFDAEARRVLGISGEELLHRFDGGVSADVHRDGENVGFVELEMPISWGR